MILVAPTGRQGPTDATQVMDLGLLAYRAPELFRLWVTPQADIYVLGVVLHPLLTGKRHFGSRNAVWRTGFCRRNSLATCRNGRHFQQRNDWQVDLLEASICFTWAAIVNAAHFFLSCRQAPQADR